MIRLQGFSFRVRLTLVGIRNKAQDTLELETKKWKRESVFQKRISRSSMHYFLSYSGALHGTTNSAMTSPPVYPGSRVISMHSPIELIKHEPTALSIHD